MAFLGLKKIQSLSAKGFSAILWLVLSADGQNIRSIVYGVWRAVRRDHIVGFAGTGVLLLTGRDGHLCAERQSHTKDPRKESQTGGIDPGVSEKLQRDAGKPDFFQ